MSKASTFIHLTEGLFSPGFEEFAEFVFRDYSKKYNAWISKGAQGKQPDLKPVIVANHKKFIGYNSDNYKYSLSEIVNKYKQYRVDDLTSKYKDYPEDKKSKAMEYGLASFGINTL